jgi:DNA modification methylase
MDPYFTDGNITIYCGDARELIDSLTFDVIVTDPPYGVNWKPDKRTTQGVPVIGDHDDELAGWVCNLPYPRLVFGASHFPRHLPEPGQWVCWDKRVSENADRMPGAPFEMAWSTFHTYDTMIRVQHGGAVNDDKRGRQRVHPTQKPERLMRHILNQTPAGIVLDPFMGSGTTLRAAQDLGRTAIGIEIDEQYCEHAVERLAQQVLPW